MRGSLRPSSALALSALALVAFARSARASSCGSPLVSTCINDDTLWPHGGPQRFLTFGGTETTARGQIGFGLFTSYLSRPITLHLPSPGPGGADQPAVNDQVNGTFLWSYGVTDRLELELALPITFGQGGAGVQPITGGQGLADTAMRDLRFGAAYAIVQRPRVDPETQRAWGLTARFETSAPTGDQDQFAGERAAVFVPSVAGDVRTGRFFAGIELGARLRPDAELVGARVGSQLLAAGGVGFDVLRRELLSVTAEARVLPTLGEQHTSVQAAQGLESSPNGTRIFPAEWAVAARTAPLMGGDFSIQLGGGGALANNAPITTPRWRFSLALTYAPIARDTDGDGIPDRDDRCPDVPGSRASGGCAPEVPPAPPAFSMRPATRPSCDDDPDTVDGFDDEACPDGDQDHDGISDYRDKCPTQAEDYAGLTDGCPEPR